MTEKRFDFGDNINLVFDNKQSKSYGLYNISSLIDLLNALHEENNQLHDKINHYDEVWVKELKKELKIIEENLRFIQPFLQDPVMTRFTAPYHEKKTILLKRRMEIKQILEELEND